MDLPAAPSNGRRWIVGLIGLGLVGGLVGLGAVALPARLAYTVTPDAVEVEAALGPFETGRTIAKADITEAHAIRLSGGRKSAGSNRPGHCVGAWRYPEIGTVWQATACGDRAVLLVTEAQKVIVEPADRDGFLRALLKDGAPGRFPAAASAGAKWLTWLAALPVLGVVAFLVSARKLLRPFVYVVADGKLTVPAHFSPVTVSLAGARVALGELTGWRVAGSGAPGLYLGNFRDGKGGYHAAATAKRGVWIGGEQRVFVTPADPEAFVEAVVAEGAVRVEA